MPTSGKRRLPRGARGAPDAGRPAGDPRPALPAAGAGRIELAAGVVLAVVAFALYARTGGFPFTNFDDFDYVVDNPHVAQGLTLGNLGWAFSTIELEFWHPLTWLSYMVEVSLFGLRPGPMHLVNAGLHAANSVLLFLALTRLSGARGRSACVAALFAVHPLHVESVAWISERKDVLSIFFGLLALIAYAGHARRPGRGRLWLVAAAFAASLMAKSTLVTLPLLLLLLDAWPLRRLRLGRTDERDAAGEIPKVGWGRALVEKLPLLAMSVASSLVTVAAQARGGSIASDPSALRFDNAIVSYLRYLGKLLWPSDLAVFYPLRHAGEPLGEVLAALAALVLITASAVALRRRAPWFTVGWLWFTGTLVPMSGLVQVGSHAMADRYTYFPSIGLFVALVWAAARLQAWRRVAWAAPALGLGVLGLLAFRTDRQVRLWADDEQLFQHALSTTGPNVRAHEMLANVLQNRGRNADAYEHLAEAVRILPNPHSLTALGGVLVRLGDGASAEQAYERALALDPRYDEAAMALAERRIEGGRLDEGIALLEGVLGRAPGNPEVCSLLSEAYFNRGDRERAERYALQAVEGGARNAGALLVLGAVRLARGDAAGAAEVLGRAVNVDPQEPFRRRLRAGALAGLGRWAEACEDWRVVHESPRATSEDREGAAQAAKDAGCRSVGGLK